MLENRIKRLQMEQARQEKIAKQLENKTWQARAKKQRYFEEKAEL